MIIYDLPISSGKSWAKKSELGFRYSIYVTNRARLKTLAKVTDKNIYCLYLNYPLEIVEIPRWELRYFDYLDTIEVGFAYFKRMSKSIKTTPQANDFLKELEVYLNTKQG